MGQVGLIGMDELVIDGKYRFRVIDVDKVVANWRGRDDSGEGKVLVTTLTLGGVDMEGIDGKMVIYNREWGG